MSVIPPRFCLASPLMQLKMALAVAGHYLPQSHYSTLIHGVLTRDQLESDMATMDNRLGPITRSFQAVLGSFCQLQSSFRKAELSSLNIDGFSLRFENELTRFKMWTGSLGAHQVEDRPLITG